MLIFGVLAATPTFIINAHSILCPSKIHQSCFSLLYHRVFICGWICFGLCACVHMCEQPFIFFGVCHVHLRNTLFYGHKKSSKEEDLKALVKTGPRLNFEFTQNMCS